MGDEISEISKIGHPAIAEKGSRESSMPELMSLIKVNLFWINSVLNFIKSIYNTSKKEKP